MTTNTEPLSARYSDSPMPPGDDDGPLLISRRVATASQRLRIRELPVRILRALSDTAPFAFAGLAVGLPLTPLLTFVVVGAILVRPTFDAARLNPNPLGNLNAIAGRTALAGVALALLPVTEARTPQAAWGIPLAIAGVVLLRGLTIVLRRELNRREIGLDRAIIVGSGPIAVTVADVLGAHLEYGVKPIGFLDHKAPLGSDLPLLGDPRELASMILTHDVRRVILAFGTTGEHEMIPVLRDCSSLPIEVAVHAVPRFFELGFGHEDEVDDIRGFPLVRMRGAAGFRRGWRMKRVFDAVVSATMLLVFSPVLAVIALAVQLTSSGPILFKQTRIGQWGRPIEMLKFRSLLDRPDNDSSWQLEADRVTSIGRIIRPTHLDELPQLWNVLRGDMSIVGPRPERPAYVDRFVVEIPRYEDRHRVPAGITGWAQVNGLMGETSSLEERARFDNRYIEDWTLWKDVRILLRTLPTLLRRSEDVQEATR